MKITEHYLRETIREIIANVIAESRLSDAINKHPEIKEQLEDLAHLLPEKLHKFIPWAAEKIDPDETNVVKLADLLKSFDKNTQRIEKKDINAYDSIEELEKTLSKLAVVSKTQEKKAIAQDVDKIYESERYLVVSPKTTTASQKYGKGTRWCVSAKQDNPFVEYDIQTILAFIIDKQVPDKTAIAFIKDVNNAIKQIEYFSAEDETLQKSQVKEKFGVEWDKIYSLSLAYAKKQDKSITPEKLDVMSNNDDIKIRLYVAGHDLTSAKTLDKLASDKDEDVKLRIASNPNKSLKTLIRLSNDENVEVRRFIARDINTPKEILIKLTNDDDENVKRDIAQNSSTPLEMLIKLMNDKNEFIRYDVAKNTNVPQEILIKLSNDKNPTIRCGVAQNSNTTQEALIKLANDEYEDVRMYVAQNPNTPKEALIKLANDKYSFVKDEAELSILKTS